ncbi:MAG: Fe-S cluster assembly protein SufD [Candidatus Nanopelagicales bacterium]
MSAGLVEREILVKNLDARPDRILSRKASDFAIPTGREEEWRFAPLARFGELHTDAPADSKVIFSARHSNEVNSRALSREDQTSFMSLDRIGARAIESWDSGIILEIPQSSEIAAPIYLDVITTKGISFGHIVIRVGANSKSTVVIEHQGAGNAAVTVEVHAENAAQLDLVTLFDSERDAVLVSEHELNIGKDARVRTLAVQLGADVLRFTPRAKFTQDHGSVEIFGGFLASGGQYIENRVLVDHNQPNCVSNVLFRGGGHGENSHTVWVGDVLIRENARGTDTYEMNRNLLLDDGARADSVPNLEIETGDILRAGHASVTGRLDDDQLFYIQSRGIDAATAKRLVIEGFFADMFGEFKNPEVAELLAKRLEETISLALVAQL